MRIWLYLAAISVLCSVLWYGYHKIEQSGYDRARNELQEANLEVAIAYANKLTEAEGERDANQVIIDRLATERVPVHFPVCPNKGTKDSNGAAGILSRRMEQSFADFQYRVTVLFERCEALNADAIKINAVTF